MKTIISLFSVACILFSSQAHAQKNSTFEAFIKKLESSPLKERQLLVDRYLSKTKTTPIIEGKEKSTLSGTARPIH